MRVRIEPGRPAGTQEAPPSKSMAHRLMICAALAEGQSVVRHVDVSEDMLATADCLKALGAGCDLLLCPVSDREALAECMTVMLAALEAENITRERLEESVIRILTMKILHGIL